MNKEIKAKWIDALRSGNYKQGTGALRRTYDDAESDQFCCLGVLCDIAVAEGVIGPPIMDDETAPLHYYDGAGGALPKSVADWASISYDTNLEQRALMNMNDSGDSFEKIANHIEETL